MVECGGKGSRAKRVYKQQGGTSGCADVREHGLGRMRVSLCAGTHNSTLCANVLEKTRVSELCGLFVLCCVREKNPCTQLPGRKSTETAKHTRAVPPLLSHSTHLQQVCELPCGNYLGNRREPDA